MVCEKQIEKTCVALNARQLSPFLLSLHFFSHHLFKLFCLLFCFSSVRETTTMDRWLALRDMAKDVLGQPVYLSFVFHSLLCIFWSSCPTFLEYDLTLFFACSSSSTSSIIIPTMFYITDIEVLYPTCGYNFNPRVRVSYVLFHLW